MNHDHAEHEPRSAHTQRVFTEGAAQLIIPRIPRGLC